MKKLEDDSPFACRQYVVKKALTTWGWQDICFKDHYVYAAGFKGDPPTRWLLADLFPYVTDDRQRFQGITPQ